jgi:fucose permease
VNRPRLDRPTIVAYLQLALVAFFLTGFGPTQALLRDEQGTTKVVSSLHATVFALAGIIAALLAPRLVAKFGRSTVLSIGVVLFCLGLAGYLAPLGPAVTLPSIGLVSMCSATLLICFSAFLLDYQGLAGPSALTQANALAAIAGVLAPLAIGVGAALIFGWRFGIWIIVIALLVTEIFLRRPMRCMFDIATAEGDRRITWRHLPRRMWWSVLLVSLFSAVELTTFLWSADLLRDRADASPALAAGLVSILAMGMVVGRVIGAKLAQSRPIDRLLSFSGVIALAGFALAWISTQTLLIAAGLFTVGLGLALNWPLGIARAVHASGGWATEATSLASVAGGIALAIVPLTLGALAQSVGIHLAFLLLPGLLIVALVILRAKPQASDLPLARQT